jgi:hypothetical protein
MSISKSHLRIGGLTRRQFLKGAAAASGAIALPWIIPGWALGADGGKPASERLTMGLIGHGAMGRGHLQRLAGDKGIQVLGVCEADKVRRDEAKAVVDQTYAAQRATEKYDGCVAYNDYRELIARKDLDGVVIATPDHWHTLQSIDAAKAGKDVYCEKPISLTVQEGRRLVEVIRRNSRVFQTGTQYRSNPTIRRVCEIIRTGGLGKIKSVFTLWASLAGFIGGERFKPYAAAISVEKQGALYYPTDVELPTDPTPEGLDWEMWVGPAAFRPYCKLLHINPSPGVVPWSFCEDYGAASSTWFHSHAADVIQYALGMETSGPVEFIHPSSGHFPTMTCKYANGTLLHLVDHWGVVKDVYKAVPASARLEGNFGGVFVGEKGWITSMTGGGRIEGGPDTIFDEIKLTNRELSGGNNHHDNWFECIRTRQQPSSHEEIGHRSASLGHLTIIAYKLGRSLKWDPAKEEFIGDDAANRLLARPVRAPWKM